MLITEHEVKIPLVPSDSEWLEHFRVAVAKQLPSAFIPLRFVVSRTSVDAFHCEVAGLRFDTNEMSATPDSIFRFARRGPETANEFNTVLMIPTGVGAEIGGHAGDGAPVARLLSMVCDRVILHPNVVNASDINEMPESALYVEGSVLSRFLMGTVGLQPVRSNRVLVVIDAHRDEAFVNAAINSVSGARAAYGLNCPEVVCLDPPVKLRARFASSGRAAGRVESLEALFALLRERRTDYDAVALSSVIDVPNEFHLGYFEAAGKMINPWGGVEAMLTHATSSLLDVPTAHSPMFESQAIANLDPGIVDPRMAAEAVSMTFLQCILKGLQRSPRIITSPDEMRMPGVLTAEDVHCLVIPDGCLGLPVIAALEQGIAVITVCENSNRMSNNLSVLPWRSGQFFRVDNYWEAAGVIAALRAGITPDSVRRPLAATSVSIVKRTQEYATLSVPQRENDGTTSQ